MGENKVTTEENLATVVKMRAYRKGYSRGSVRKRKNETKEYMYVYMHVSQLKLNVILRVTKEELRSDLL